jgi:uncharacterized OsmC-like protein
MNTEDREPRQFAVTLSRRRRFEFLVDFHERDVPGLTMDEPPPLGEGHGPNAARVLAAAIGNCLSASLLYCLERARVPVTDLTATIEGEMIRNPKGRLRIADIRVKLMPRIGVDPSKIERCLTLVEDFCVVTQSVREGIDVQVEVEPVLAEELSSVPD